MLASLDDQAQDSTGQPLCTKDGLTEVNAAVVIDTTGDANATALAGLPMHIPSETSRPHYPVRPLATIRKISISTPSTAPLMPK